VAAPEKTPKTPFVPLEYSMAEESKIRSRCIGCVHKSRGASRWQIAFVLGVLHERELVGLQEVDLCKTHERMMRAHGLAAAVRDVA
jgi:hypothetical protein